jgi:hypothetical protein
MGQLFLIITGFARLNNYCLFGSGIRLIFAELIFIHGGFETGKRP